MEKMPPILSQHCQLKIVYGLWLENSRDTGAIIFLGDEYFIHPFLGLASRVAFTCGGSGGGAILAVSLLVSRQFSIRNHSG